MTLDRIVLSALVSTGLVAAATCDSLSTLKLAATTITAVAAASATAHAAAPPYCGIAWLGTSSAGAGATTLQRGA